jgi:hypothetical protein
MSSHTQKEKTMCKALRLLEYAVLAGGLSFAGACSDSSSVTAPTVNRDLASGSTSVAAQVHSTETANTRAVTDETLAAAGWTCIQPGNGLTLCFPPGPGAPPFKPVVGQPTYTFMTFTSDHQYVHRGTLRRADLYHGEPCLGGAPWNYLGFVNLDYFECINPA